MATSFSLAVYAITINKMGEKDELQVLTDFGDAGTDLLSDLYSMCLSWKQDVGRGDKFVPVQKDTEPKSKNAFRLGIKGQDEYHLIKTGQYIKGIVESGEFGTIEDGVNVETGELSFKKSASDVLLKPFYFMFYIPKDSCYGFLIVERISQMGVATVLKNAIQKYCKGLAAYNNYTLKISPVAVDKLIEHRMAVLKYETRSIELRKVQDERLKISKVSDNQIDDKDVSTSIMYKMAGKLKDVTNFINSVKKKRNEHDTFYVIDKDLKCDDIAVTVKIDGNDRVLSLQDIRSLGFSMDITDEVAPLDPNGYPSFEKVDKQASVLVTYIKEQYAKLNEE